MAMQLAFLCLVLLKLTTACANPLNEAYGGDAGCPLGTDIYQYTCPEAEAIIFSWVEQAVSEDSRMAASLLRLHFHDCFVNARHSLSAQVNWPFSFFKFSVNLMRCIICCVSGL